jgi:hypothetical protein
LQIPTATDSSQEQNRKQGRGGCLKELLFAVHLYLPPLTIDGQAARLTLHGLPLHTPHQRQKRIT